MEDQLVRSDPSDKTPQITASLEAMKTNPESGPVRGLTLAGFYPTMRRQKKENMKYRRFGNMVKRCLFDVDMISKMKQAVEPFEK